jgi:hypothetical protein
VVKPSKTLEMVNSIPRPVPAPPVHEMPIKPVMSSSIHSLADIKIVDDLKKIDVAHIRQGTLEAQILTIKSKIYSLAAANRLIPYYTVNAFEQSPLFKSYLKHGSAKVTGGGEAGDLTQEEFEALTDLRKELERA